VGQKYSINTKHLKAFHRNWKARECPSSPCKEAESKAGTLSPTKGLCDGATFRSTLAIFDPRLPNGIQVSP